MRKKDECLGLPPEISLDSSPSKIASTLAPLRAKAIDHETRRGYSQIKQRLLAIQEALWHNSMDENVVELVRSVITFVTQFDTPNWSSNHTTYSLGQLHDTIKTLRPDLGGLIEEAMILVKNHAGSNISKLRSQTAIAIRFHPETAPKPISELIGGIIETLTIREGEILSGDSDHFVDFHASCLQELNWLSFIGLEPDRTAIRSYLRAFFDKQPFALLNPSNAVDCLSLYAHVSHEKPNPDLIDELVQTVRTQIRTVLSEYLARHQIKITDQTVEDLIRTMDDHFDRYHDRFDFYNWRPFVEKVGVELDDFTPKEFEPTNTAIFRHESALSAAHSLLMDFGQFDQAIDLVPLFLASQNALTAVRNSQGDAILLRRPDISDRLLDEYVKAYGRSRLDNGSSFNRKFDSHLPYDCALLAALRFGKLNELTLTDEIRAAIRNAKYTLFERIETFLNQPIDSEWFEFGQQLLSEALDGSHKASSLYDEDEVLGVLHTLLFYKSRVPNS